jgi:TPR repeat protein
MKPTLLPAVILALVAALHAQTSPERTAPPQQPTTPCVFGHDLANRDMIARLDHAPANNPAMAESFRGYMQLCEVEKPNYVAAHQYFIRALEMGDATSAWYLAQMNINAIGVPRDFVAGIRYLTINTCILQRYDGAAMLELVALPKYMTESQKHQASAILQSLKSKGCSVSGILPLLR